MPTTLAVSPDEEKKGFAILDLMSKVQEGFSTHTEAESFICAGRDIADILKYSPQMDNEGKALGEALTTELWRNK